MKFLEKINPHATRASVIRAAIRGSVGCFLFTLFAIWYKDMEVCLGVFMLVCMTVAGAGIGAVMEWQYYDGDEDETPSSPPP